MTWSLAVLEALLDVAAAQVADRYTSQSCSDDDVFLDLVRARLVDTVMVPQYSRPLRLTQYGWQVEGALRQHLAQLTNRDDRWTELAFTSFVPPAQLVDDLTLESAKAHLKAARAIRDRETCYHMAAGLGNQSSPCLTSMDAWIDLLTQMTGGAT